MKKVFLSLATIAFVAAGSLTVTSCGGDDDSTQGPVTPPVEELTENFVKVNSDKFALNYTQLAYESNKAVTGADFFEQALNPQDPTKLYVVWRYATMAEQGNSESLVISWFATVVDQSQTGNARYKLPFTTDSQTVRLNTAASVAETEYSEAETDELVFTLGDNFSYADGTENIDLTVAGTLDGVSFDMDIDHALDMLYYYEVEAGAKNSKNLDVKAEVAGKVSATGLSRK